MRILKFKQRNLIQGFLTIIFLINFMCPLLSFAELNTQGHALLVGCTKYEYLIRDYWLRGPKNDVELMYKLLTTEMFRFKPEQITKLAGWPDDEQQRPTKANIEREFKRLAEVAGKGDQVVILLAGHGSQQPADEDPKDLEPDGFDEIFLPADVKAWNFNTGRIENAIVDDELREWLTAIRDTGAFVWFIADSCHSGTLSRYPLTGILERRLLPEELNIPKEVLEIAAKRAAGQIQTRGIGKDIGILELSDDADDIVALYAAQSTETTFEMPISGCSRGIFTYTLATVLRKSASSLTYRELVERATTRYRSKGFNQPTPLIEGGALDREVLGLREWPDRPKILLGEEDPDNPGSYEVKMGGLQGLREGDILGVYPPAGEQDADKPTGHVKVTVPLPFTSLVEPVEFAEIPAPGKEQLRPGSRCKVVFVNYGDLRMKVAVQRQINAGETPALPGGGTPEVTTFLPKAGPEVIESALAKLAEEKQFTNMVERVTTAAEAEWLIRVVNDQIRLIPASGVTGQDAELSQFMLGSPTQTTDVLAQKLSNALLRIAKASNLMEIAPYGYEGPIQVQVELLHFKNVMDRKGEPLPYETAGRILRPGDLIAFRVTNPTNYEIDVTLLFIDSGYGITAFFPEPGTLDDNRLPPGKTIRTPRARIKGDTFGLEQLVTIAVKSSKERLNFSCLEQPTLAQARAPEGGQRALDSPLGQLLEGTMYGEYGEELEGRGIEALELDNYALHLLNWRTMPVKE